MTQTLQRTWVQPHGGQRLLLPPCYAGVLPEVVAAVRVGMRDALQAAVAAVDIDVATGAAWDCPHVLADLVAAVDDHLDERVRSVRYARYGGEVLMRQLLTRLPGPYGPFAYSVGLGADEAERLAPGPAGVARFAALTARRNLTERGPSNPPRRV